MSQYVETPTRQFTAGAARDQYLRVKLSGTSLATAGATDVSVGIQERESFAAADLVPVRLRGGRNRILLKIEERGNEWGFCARFVPFDQSALPELFRVVPEDDGGAALACEPLKDARLKVGIEGGDDVGAVNGFAAVDIANDVAAGIDFQADTA